MGWFVANELTAEIDCASSRPEETRDGLQGRRLAGPVRTNQCDDLTLIDVERDAFEGLDVAVVSGDVLDVEHGRGVAMAIARNTTRHREPPSHGPRPMTRGRMSRSLPRRRRRLSPSKPR